MWYIAIGGAEMNTQAGNALFMMWADWISKSGSFGKYWVIYFGQFDAFTAQKKFGDTDIYVKHQLATIVVNFASRRP